MLDAAIRVSGSTAGVVCLEQVGPQRSWFDDEIIFACTIADQVVQVILHQERTRAENALRESENSYRMLSAYNERLNEIFIYLTEAATLDELFSRVADSFRSLTGAVAATSSRYNKDSKSLKIVAVSSEGHLTKRIEQFFGQHVFSLTMPVPDEIVGEMLRMKINHFAGLAEASFWQIPEDISREAMDLLDSDLIVILTLQYESELFGTASAFLPRRSAMVHADAMKTFSYLTGLAINRKLTEIALLRSTERLHTVVASAPLVLFAIDGNGTFILAEGAGLDRLALDPASVINKSIYDVYRAVPEILEAVRLALGGMPHHGEVRVGALWFEIWFTPVRDESGRIMGCMGVGIDVTERKEAEEDRERIQAQLIQAQKMEAVGTLAGGIAHDFNNMLGGILGSLDMAGRLLEKEELTHGDSLRKYLETALESSRRAADLTRQMLTLSRKHEIEPRPVDLAVAISNVIALCENSFPKSVTITLDRKESSFIVEGEPSHLEQVFLNLCVNASHAMTIMRADDEKQGGTLRISLEAIDADHEFGLVHPEAARDRAYARVAVSDTGVGVDEEIRQHIFEPFYTTKKRDEGTGLGLAMVYGMVKQHGGFIDVASEPGVGTTFAVYLPLMEREASTWAQASGTGGLVMGSGTLLVIDDEKSILRIARGMLEHCGYGVMIADSGDAGIALFAKKMHAVDAVILDLSMPGLSGLEVYERLKEIRPGVRVLLTSGLMEEDSMKQARSSGIRDFLQKPYSAEELSAKVASLLKR